MVKNVGCLIPGSIREPHREGIELLFHAFTITRNSSVSVELREFLSRRRREGPAVLHAGAVLGEGAGVSEWNERNPWKTGHNDDGALKGRQESV
jgi:hypothetical protein